MNWSEQLSNYCERGGDMSLWAEPLNLISNLAFIIAGVAAWRLYKKSPRNDGGFILLLISLLFIIAIGSALFHSFATRWAMLADIIPILLFTYIYQGLFVRRVISFGRWQMWFYLVTFFVASEGLAQIFGEDALNGSIFYVPILLALGGFALYMRFRRYGGAGSIGLAALLFVISLSLRTADQALCDIITCGTHFLWHLLNATVLYLLLRGWMEAEGGECSK